MTLRKTAIKALGNLLIMGFNGLELAEETQKFIREANIGSVIYFTHNYENPGQLAELSNQIQECRDDYPLWISADQEGGKVQRFRKGFTLIPDAASVGAMESPKLTFEVAEVIAKELRAVGINLNFCPVADIATNPKNPVIGSRAYGSDAETVTKMTTAVIRGHLVNGVQPCIKHFPGHGDTSTDSHFSLPRIDNGIELLLDRELVPFKKAFRSKCSMVMTAHILNSHLDKDFPATLSRLVLQGLLREQCRYSKVIISDDMEMKAITSHFGAADAPRMALEAGCDMLIYRSEQTARLAYENLVKALEEGKLDPNIVLEAQDRVLATKRDFFSDFPYSPVSIAELPNRIATADNQVVIHKVHVKPRSH